MKTKQPALFAIFCLVSMMALTVAAEAQNAGRPKKPAKTEQYADSVPQPTLSEITYGDHGWRDSGIYGDKDVRTPNIDR